MFAYIIRRLLLIPVTLTGIFLTSFLLINFAPGGPLEALIAEMQGISTDLGDRMIGSDGDVGEASSDGSEVTLGKTVNDVEGYTGREGLDPAAFERYREMFGLDRPWYVRMFDYFISFLRFDFKESLRYGRPVVDVIVERIPVTMGLGILGTIFTYLICIPLGIAKARRDGNRFDWFTTTGVVGVDSIPNFVLAIALIAIFAVNLQWFPLEGLVGDNFEELSWWGKIVDYLWHMTLPAIVVLVGGYSGLMMLTKNSFMDHLGQQYVTTARAKGLSESRIMYFHVFRNAMILVLSGVPGLLVGLLFTGSVFIERIFNLNGLGMLGLDALSNRDYPILYANIWVGGLMGLTLVLITDITYTLIDPRINFDGRTV